MDKLKLKTQLYTLKDIEQLLGVTKRTLIKYVNSGRLKGAKIGGKWIVTEENLYRFICGDK